MNSAQHNIVNFQDEFQLNVCMQAGMYFPVGSRPCILHEVCAGSVMNYRIYPYLFCASGFFPFYFVCLFLCKDVQNICFTTAKKHQRLPKC